jgi:7-cyano-7-deazaguanine synthase
MREWSRKLPERPVQPEVLVLLSGGLDSTAVLHFYLSERRPVIAMFVDYGQAAAEQERRASQAVCRRCGVSLLQRVVSGAVIKGQGEIPMRNAFLLALAAMERPDTVWGVATGIHAGTAYADCSEGFAALMQQIARFDNRPVDVLNPFLAWTKHDVLSYCEANDVPTALTYSCERGQVPPCGSCLSCRDRKDFDARALLRAQP